MSRTMLLAMTIVLPVSCASGAEDPAKLSRCGAWEMPWAGRLVAFYVAAPAMSESAMKTLAQAEMKAAQARWDSVIIYVNFDRALASQLGSQKTLERISKTGMGLSDMQVWNGRTPGGARLSWARKDGKEEWQYQPPPRI